MATATKPRITRTDSKVGRFYDITHADGTTARYPSVTSILSAISKPALIPWAAKEERTACATAAADLYAELAAQPQLPRSMYLLALEQRLGTTKAHVKALAQAGDIGTAAHGWVAWSLARALGRPVGPEPTLPNAALWATMAWDDFAKAVALQPQFVEQVVFSRIHQFAGTMDLLADLDTAGLLRVLEAQGPVAPDLVAWLTSRTTATALLDLKTGKSIYGEAMLQNCAYQKALIEMGHGRPDGGLIVRVPKVTTDPGFQVAVVPPARELFPVFLACRQLWAWQFEQEQAYKARTRVA